MKITEIQWNRSIQIDCRSKFIHLFHIFLKPQEDFQENPKMKTRSSENATQARQVSDTGSGISWFSWFFIDFPLILHDFGDIFRAKTIDIQTENGGIQWILLIQTQLWDAVAPSSRGLFECSDMFLICTARAASISGVYMARDSRHAIENRGPTWHVLQNDQTRSMERPR